MSDPKRKRSTKSSKLTPRKGTGATLESIDSNYSELARKYTKKYDKLLKLEDFTTLHQSNDNLTSKSAHALKSVEPVTKDTKEKRKPRSKSKDRKSKKEIRKSKARKESKASEVGKVSRESAVSKARSASRGPKEGSYSKGSIYSNESKRSKNSDDINDFRGSKVSIESKTSKKSQGSEGSEGTRSRSPVTSLESRASKMHRESVLSKESSRSVTTQSSLLSNKQRKARSSPLYPKLKSSSDISRTSLITKTSFRRPIRRIQSNITKNVVDKPFFIWKAKKHQVLEEPNVEIIPVEETEEDYIMDFDEGSEASDTSLETISEVDEDVQHFNLRKQILKTLSTIPDINDLSETSLSPTPRQQPQQLDEQQQQQEQQQRIIKSMEDIEVEGEAVEESGGEWSIESGSDSPLSMLYLSSLTSTENELFMIPTPEQDSIYSNIAHTMTSVKIRGSQVDFIEATKVDNRKGIKSICMQFMEEAIARTVDVCEEPARKLLQRLDKLKLWKKLQKLFIHYNDEANLHNRLMSKTTDHFLRKKRFVFIRQTKKYDEINHQRFNSAIIELDRMLEIENNTNDKAEFQIRQSQQQFEQKRKFCNEQQNNFEKTVRETLLQNDNFTHLKNSVDNMLSIMNRVRNEISDMRMALLFTQHRFAEMLSQSEKLEDLGEGLRMREFLLRQADVQVLTMKIAERNSDLNRFKAKINFDVHALAHWKNKQHMSHVTHQTNKQQLRTSIQCQTRLRKQIYQGKLTHNDISREIDKLKFEGGLLNYPLLLDDFDKTDDNVRAKRESVEKLRKTYNKLIRRIRVSEKIRESTLKGSTSSMGSLGKSSTVDSDLSSQLRISSIK